MVIIKRAIIVLNILMTVGSVLYADPKSIFEQMVKMPEEVQEVFFHMSLSDAAGVLMEFKALPEDVKYKLMLVTSAQNECVGCACLAVQELSKLNVPQTTIKALQTNLSQVNLTEKEKVLYLMAKEITIHPGTSSKAVKDASKVGWTDRELANAILIVSYFNYKNRVRNAFDIGPDKKHPYKPEQKLPLVSCP